MIHSLRLQNFYSFSDSVEVSFTLPKSRVSNDLSAETATGQSVSKVMSVIGANASGKTNVLKAISFLTWFIELSFSQQDAESEIHFEPHFFHENENTEFELIFDIEGKLHKYLLILTKQRVIFEGLYIKNTQFFSYIFKRSWDEENKQYDIRQKGFGFSAKEAKRVRQNTSILSTASQYQVEKSLQVTNEISLILCDVGMHGRLESRRDIDELFTVADMFHRVPDLEKKASDLLCSIDLGINKVYTKMKTFHLPQEGEKEFPVPYAVHQYEGKEKILELWKESSGTQRVYRLLRFILPVLEMGGMAVIDELEADLHPDMLEPLIKLFIDPESNPHNAQIIFSSHSHEILDLLNKEQVLLVEKDESGSSDLWRLSDMSGVRRDDNLYAKYRSGAYGAVPNI